MADVGTQISMKFSELMMIGVPILAAISAWLWKLTSKNQNLNTENKTEIRLMKQIIDTHQVKVDSMDDKVQKLTDEITKVKFSLQTLDHKQDKNHIELLNAIIALGKGD